jgi:hypothetical protein
MVISIGDAAGPEKTGVSKLGADLKKSSQNRSFTSPNVKEKGSIRRKSTTSQI